ncbi:MAG: hypothetical protein AUG51_08175 [Acidobacteria bacterium 13_1_20CM_3_53_8]|nr:MAG: hypothetical protein AUG51_08175 [Acidobacteria bacterium 13_1_20CM_3_53_8]
MFEAGRNIFPEFSSNRSAPVSSDATFTATSAGAISGLSSISRMRARNSMGVLGAGCVGVGCGVEVCAGVGEATGVGTTLGTIMRGVGDGDATFIPIEEERGNGVGDACAGTTVLTLRSRCCCGVATELARAPKLNAKIKIHAARRVFSFDLEIISKPYLSPRKRAIA